VAQAKGRLWLAEVIWVGERRRYLIAARTTWTHWIRYQ